MAKRPVKKVVKKAPATKPTVSKAKKPAPAKLPAKALPSEHNKELAAFIMLMMGIYDNVTIISPPNKQRHLTEQTEIQVLSYVSKNEVTQLRGVLHGSPDFIEL